jgi:hypothetical protein
MIRIHFALVLVLALATCSHSHGKRAVPLIQLRGHPTITKRMTRDNPSFFQFC